MTEITGITLNYYIFLQIASIISLLLSLFSTILGALALMKCLAIEKSTHSVTYMPIDPEIDKENKKYMEEWGTTEESIDKQNKEYKKEIKEKMPEFELDDEDKKIFSF